MKVLINFSTLILLFFLLAPPLLAQSGGNPSPPPLDPNLKFEHLTVDDGLSSQQTLNLLQDRQGFIWVATRFGLNRFDGYDFVTYTREAGNPNSPAANVIWNLYEDREGNLWLSTWGGGVDRYDPRAGTFSHFRHAEDRAGSLSSDQVWSVYQDRRGVVWVATDNGLNKFDPETNSFRVYRHDPADPGSLSHNSVSAIQEDENGALWLSTYGGGLNKFDPLAETFTPYRYDARHPNSLSNDFVWTVYIDRAGRIWAGTEGGLNRFDPATDSFTRYQNDENIPTSLSHNTVTAIYQDSRGILWVGTLGGGLNRFNPEDNSFTRYQYQERNPAGLASNTVWDIMEDESGILWLATDNGLDRIDPLAARFSLFQHNPAEPDSLNHNQVTALYAAGDSTLWIGTNGGGLNRFDRAQNRFSHYRQQPGDPASLSNNEVTGLLPGPDGGLWVSTRGGLNKFDPATKRFSRYTHNPANPNSLPHNNINALAADQNGRLWLASFGGGLIQFDPVTQRFRPFSQNEALPTPWLTALAITPQGVIWIGGAGGLSRFDPNSESLTNYTAKDNNLSNENITVIYQDSRQTIWAGSEDGLNKYDPATGAFVVYRTGDGLAGDLVAAILEDEQGQLWISTNNGLSRFEPQTGTFRNYEAGDGLQSNQFWPRAAARSESGELFFGGPRGFNAFSPAKLADNPYLPPVVLTDFLLFNRPAGIGGESPLAASINYADQITLTHDQSVFTFEFAALNYHAPAKNQYAYMLEGFDQDWTYVDSRRRSATYTNLDPGRYIFRVKASNNDGLWNESGAAVRLIVAPAWWQTWQFYALLAGLVVGIFALVYQAKARQLQVERALTARLRESEERFRTAFEYSASGMCLTSLDGKFLRANRALSHMLGYAVEELQDMHFNDITHPEDTEIGAEAAQRMLGGEVPPVSIEKRYLRKDGKVIWAYVTSTLLKDASGQPRHFITQIEDITGRRQAEERLRAIAAHLAAAQRIAQFGSWEISLSPALEFIEPQLWSDECYRILGLEPGSVEITKEFFYHHLHPDDREFATQALQKAVQEGAEADYEYRLIRPDGAIRYIYDQVKVILDPDTGRPVKVVGTAHDITRRKQAEVALRRERDLSEAIIDSLPGVFYLYDEQGRFLRWNKNFTRVSGYTDDEMAGRRPLDFFSGPDKELLAGRIQEVFTQGASSVEAGFVAKDGTRTPYYFTGLRIELDGRPCLLGVGIDISERKQAEEALQRYNERLTILRQIDQNILAARSLAEIVQPALQGARRLIPCTRISVAVFDLEASEVTILALDGKTESRLVAGPGMPFARNQMIEQLEAGQIIVVPELKSDQNSAAPEVVKQLIKEGMRSSLNVPLIAQAQLIGVFALADATPNHFTAEHQEIAGEVANQLAIAIHQHRLFEAEREQRLQAETLREVALALTERIEFEAILDQILIQTKRVVPYQTANIALLREGAMHIAKEQGYEAFGEGCNIAGMVQRLADSPLDRRVIETGQPLVVYDCRQDPEWVWYPQTSWIRSHLMVPIRWRDKTIGSLRLDGPTPGEFSLKDANRLMPLAAAAGIAIENARLYEQIRRHAAELEQRVAERTAELEQQYRRQAVLEERQRLARDLHDAVSQTLFSASLLAEAIPRLWERNPAQALASLADLHRLNRAALAEMRGLLLELRPAALAESNLDELLRQLVDALAGRTQAAIALSIEETGGQPPVDIKIAIFRIAQEALNNIIKHAQAGQVGVTLRSGAGRVRLAVRDDGCGFDLSPHLPGHFGLKIMRERAEAIGATLHINSRPGQGTEIELIWPETA